MNISVVRISNKSYEQHSIYQCPCLLYNIHAFASDYQLFIHLNLHVYFMQMDMYLYAHFR